MLSSGRDCFIASLSLLAIALRNRVAEISSASGTIGGNPVAISAPLVAFKNVRPLLGSFVGCPIAIILFLYFSISASSTKSIASMNGFSYS